MRDRGFSLVEVTMALIIAGIFTGFTISLLQTPENKECATTSQSRLQTIQASLTRYTEVNKRLPFPAARNIDASDPSYGREAPSGGIDSANGVSYGALPFQTLGLSRDYAGDCYNNKFSYVVTTALTSNAGIGGFMDGSVPGNITMIKDAGNVINSHVAYAVISHGEDGLGAVALNYTGMDHGWCTGTDLKSLNCNIASSNPVTLADAVPNNGKDAGALYYDDAVIFSSKPTWANSVTLYAWGWNDSGQLADGTTTPHFTPNPAKTSLAFSNVSVGASTSCGLTNAGIAYCWGYGVGGRLGDGTGNSSSVPVLVDTTLTFNAISVGNAHACALTAGGDAYCWGTNGFGELGDGTSGNVRLSPAAVSTSVKFKSISAGVQYTCAISFSGDAYCWGNSGVSSPHLYVQL